MFLEPPAGLPSFSSRVPPWYACKLTTGLFDGGMRMPTSYPGETPLTQNWWKFWWADAMATRERPRIFCNIVRERNEGWLYDGLIVVNE
jgi:hypothetical protein